MTDPFGFESVDLAWLQAKQGAKWHRHPGTLAAWVADMDFPPAPVVIRALQGLVDGGDFGYPDWRTPMAGSPVRELWAARCAERYGWQPDPHLARELNDVVQGVETVLHVATEPGDGIVLLTPSYPPLRRAIVDNGRRLVAHHRDGAAWDLDALDERLRHEHSTVLLLCHPHNPTGHVFTEAELRRIAEIAERHDLIVISDEIHADLTYSPAVHLPMALYAPDRTVTLHSASKAFNLAGLRYAIAHIGPPLVMERMLALPDHLGGAISVAGALATRAAWAEGDEWLGAVVAHFDRMRHLLADLLHAALPEVVYTPPEATYLAWLDCRALDLADEPVEVFRRRGVSVSPGPDFDPSASGFVRLNFATSSSILEQIVGRLAG